MSKREKRSRHRGKVPPGFCFCTNCGGTIPHKVGVRCRLLKCPKCGAKKLIESPWQAQL